MIYMKIVVEGILVTPFVGCLHASETRQLCSDAQAKHTTVSNTTYVIKSHPRAHDAVIQGEREQRGCRGGAAMRCTATTVCASPFVAPSKRLFGAAAAVNCEHEHRVWGSASATQRTAESDKLTESHVGDAHRSELQHHEQPHALFVRVARFWTWNMTQITYAATLVPVRPVRPSERICNDAWEYYGSLPLDKIQIRSSLKFNS
jgi:hypothetical protein